MDSRLLSRRFPGKILDRAQEMEIRRKPGEKAHEVHRRNATSYSLKLESMYGRAKAPILNWGSLTFNELGKPATPELFEDERPGEVDPSQHLVKIIGLPQFYWTQLRDPSLLSPLEQRVRSDGQNSINEGCGSGCFILKIKIKLYLIKMLKNLQGCTAGSFEV